MPGYYCRANQGKARSARAPDRVGQLFHMQMRPAVCLLATAAFLPLSLLFCLLWPSTPGHKLQIKKFSAIRFRLISQLPQLCCFYHQQSSIENYYDYDNHFNFNIVTKTYFYFYYYNFNHNYFFSSKLLILQFMRRLVISKKNYCNYYYILKLQLLI